MPRTRAALLLLLVASCGARSSLRAPHVSDTDASTRDASIRDASTFDASEGARSDAFDGSRNDAVVFDGGPDAAVPCTEGPGALAYLWDSTATLWRFDPRTLATTRVGLVDCAETAYPWTFSVSRAGVAYMTYTDDQIFSVDLATLACTPTPIDPTRIGIVRTLAISVSRDRAAERLFVYGTTAAGAQVLGVADLSSFDLTEIAQPAAGTVFGGPDMQADLGGRLDLLGGYGDFVQLDTATGTALGPVIHTAFDTHGQGGWAILVWNDDVLFFGGIRSMVSRYDVATDTVTTLGSLPIEVVGASAAACLH